MKKTDNNGLTPQNEEAPKQEKTWNPVSDPAKVGALVEQYRPLVYAIASRFRGIEFDDLVQEGMLGLWSAARRFNPSQGSSFGAFAALCIQRRMLAMAASHRKRVDISFSQLDTDVEVFGEKFFPQEDSALNPENLLILKEDVAAMQQRMREMLSPLERRILQLYLEGCSYQEIAERLSITSKAVDNGLQRIRRKLRDS